MLAGFELDTPDHELGVLSCADIFFVSNMCFAVCFAFPHPSPFPIANNTNSDSYSYFLSSS